MRIETCDMTGDTKKIRDQIARLEVSREMRDENGGHPPLDHLDFSRAESVERAEERIESFAPFMMREREIETKRDLVTIWTDEPQHEPLGRKRHGDSRPHVCRAPRRRRVARGQVMVGEGGRPRIRKGRVAQWK